jgi:predicted hotdog family 3-hydroxylacyl-ACP dehydratase
MRLVDRLVEFGDGDGCTESVLPADSPMASPGGALDPVALVELIAQSYAAVKGYDDMVHGRPVAEGFLVGIRKMRIAGAARAGERLLTRVKTVGTFEGFAVVEGAVTRGDETLASGTLKLWIVDRAATAGATP